MIIDRIRAHGGEVIRDEWRFELRPGRLTPEALAWVRAHAADLRDELWPEHDAWRERAAILEYDAGMPRAEAERRAYEMVMR